MASDISRIRSNPLLDVAGVTLKQGGVVLDADVNELVDVLDRRLRALASDVLGRSTVSQTTPNAFKLSVLGGMLMIAAWIGPIQPIKAAVMPNTCTTPTPPITRTKPSSCGSVWSMNL